jgi:hypothetical protein
MRIYSEKRRELFEEYMLLKNNIQDLAGIVQNDMELTVEDLLTFRNSTDEAIDKLKELYRKITIESVG